MSCHGKKRNPAAVVVMVSTIAHRNVIGGSRSPARLASADVLDLATPCGLGDGTLCQSLPGNLISTERR